MAKVVYAEIRMHLATLASRKVRLVGPRDTAVGVCHPSSTVELLFCKQWVIGSNPVGGSEKVKSLK